MTHFTAVQDFFSPELQSHYIDGLSYTARPQDKKLLALLPGWVEAGKVVYGRPAQSFVSGKGE